MVRGITPRTSVRLVKKEFTQLILHYFRVKATVSDFLLNQFVWSLSEMLRGNTPATQVIIMVFLIVNGHFGVNPFSDGLYILVSSGALLLHICPIGFHVLWG